MIPPETFEAIGIIVAAAGSSWLGGRNSNNGMERRLVARLDHIDEKIDVLMRADGEHEARLEALERDVG